MKTWDSYVEQWLTDPVAAAAYLEAALLEYGEDGQTQAFLLALGRLVEAQGGVGALARKSGLNRQHLYRILSGSGNPTWSSIQAIIRALGMGFSVHPLPSPQKKAAST
jgi:probable addiction module antidote protein